MRTKTLLLTAAAALLVGASAMAQTNVYSVNAVGYVNLVIPPGFNIIANPLNTTNNLLSSVMPAPPENTTVYLFNQGSGYTICTYAQDDFGNLLWDNNASFPPGAGAWIKNPTTHAFTNTFVGEVAQGNLTNNIPVGFTLKSSQVPQAGHLQTALGYVPAENDTVYIYTPGSGYTICTYAQDDFGNLFWDNPPNVAVAQGFWLKSANTKSWSRSFSVNN